MKRRHLHACTLAPLLLALGVSTPLRAQTMKHAQTAQFAGSRLFELVGIENDPILAAYSVYERTGHARVIDPERAGGYVIYPFGHERPVVRCPRLNACMIRLERGEALTDQPLAGDTERWVIETGVTGSGQESPLIVIKPRACDIATNMLVPTTRRVYELALVSDGCNNNGGDETFTRQVRFWYPEQMRADRATREQGLKADSANTVSDSTPQTAPPLNRDYKIDRGGGFFGGRKDYPWIPTEIFDDGVRTYVVLPEQAGTSKLPILYELEGGNRQVLNYVLRGDTIVADHVLERGELVVGTGDGQQELEFENRGKARKKDERSNDRD